MLCPGPLLPLFLSLPLRSRFVEWQLRQVTHMRIVTHPTCLPALRNQSPQSFIIRLSSHSCGTRCSRPLSVNGALCFYHFLFPAPIGTALGSRAHLCWKLPLTMDLLPQRNSSPSHKEKPLHQSLSLVWVHLLAKIMT